MTRAQGKQADQQTLPFWIGRNSNSRSKVSTRVFSAHGEGRRTPKAPLEPPISLAAPELPEKDQFASPGVVLLVDKPKGWTSFDVCGKLKGSLRRIGAKKVGHAGTLDPMATGLLIVCAGKATKQVDNYQAMDKVYSGTMKLGENTPSYDADSEVDETLPWQHISDDDIEQAVAAQFIGAIPQVPPMYSALKVKGERLYEKARRGEVIERKARVITVSRFDTWRDDNDAQLVHFLVVRVPTTLQLA
ncbi:hypothetical protein CYMTET_11771 [Cymbomonas tetramitiformis]|uniref:tRNA pseudouridine(55) synthase n=1 Tax=Cymbomonas tetramitiformis TaxID=36881 RepID=A0AAE0GN16_9CHLO|nr:hypothetical protein CYMTET_11771 [Cymbomonas tetramitiformis]